jgi:hypothetical protein
VERVLPTVRDEAGSKPQIVREKLVMHDLCQFYGTANLEFLLGLEINK